MQGPDQMVTQGTPDAGPLIKETTDALFPKDVIEASMHVPVIVDFWAPWCGPCKQLGPVLEGAVNKANGAVSMVKVNIDENPMIAQQLQVQSIPAVFAFMDGKPVDGFMGAQPESQITAFVEKLTAQGSNDAQDPVAAALAQADELLSQEDVNGAADLYSQILEHEQDQIGAVAGLAQCYIKMGSIEGAAGLLEELSEESLNDPLLGKIKAAVALADEASDVIGEVDMLKSALEQNPDNHQARFDLALATFAKGDTQEAMTLLLELFRRDRDWNEGAARAQLLKNFEAIGHADPVVMKARRNLSTLMFS